MDYIGLYEKMHICGMISDEWGQLVRFLSDELKSEQDRDRFLKLFIVYFSLIEDGNVYMSLDESVLLDKVKEKTSKLKIQFDENEVDMTSELDKILEEITLSMPFLAKVEGLSIIGSNKLFLVDNERLFTRKYYNAVKGIQNSAKRLFTDNAQKTSSFDYHKVVSNGFVLADAQESIINKGLYNNLLVTGGPGTGKTTSIFFLLMSLLEESDDYRIYLTAPSGKAADRMKESIQEQCSRVNALKNTTALETIKALESYTIHRLLGYSYETNGFIHNKNNRFDDRSVFIIDEASMIDVCLFASLLEAIPDNARIFILGDKDQLPSVECGAVFAELLQSVNPKNVVRLTESKRFSKDSEIYVLSEAVNSGNTLPVEEDDWKPYDSFEICADAEGRKNPIFYYSDESKNNKDMIKEVSLKWYDHYYSELRDKCINLTQESESFADIFKIANNSRILCANNDGARGIKNINRIILSERFDINERQSGVYPGELIMITQNDYSIGLYNGDCGIVVRFTNDANLYVMFNKPSSINIEDGKQENRVFKLGDYIFYPVRMIDSSEIIPAFAITIHKSQGSDYGNILVILPKLKGHPLLNRQILYTAVTRTKGETYILSNQKNLEAARDSVLIRDTGIQ